jgi:hypothetical protein
MFSQASAMNDQVVDHPQSARRSCQSAVAVSAAASVASDQLDEQEVEKAGRQNISRLPVLAARWLRSVMRSAKRKRANDSIAFV